MKKEVQKKVVQPLPRGYEGVQNRKWRRGKEQRRARHRLLMMIGEVPNLQEAFDNLRSIKNKLTHLTKLLLL